MAALVKINHYYETERDKVNVNKDEVTIVSDHNLIPLLQSYHSTD